jgi:hypothetical protein
MAFREMLSLTYVAFACAFADANAHSLGRASAWAQPAASRVCLITEREDDETGEQRAGYQPLASGPALVIVIRTITRCSRRIASR